MHFDSDSVREMPLRYQEQVAMALVAQSAKANPVAGQEGERNALRVPVKRLCFAAPRGVEKYRTLRDAVREGVISDLTLAERDGKIVAFSYKIQWAMDFVPCTIPHQRMLWWRERVRQRGKGTTVYENI